MMMMRLESDYEPPKKKRYVSKPDVAPVELPKPVLSKSIMFI